MCPTGIHHYGESQQKVQVALKFDSPYEECHPPQSKTWQNYLGVGVAIRTILAKYLSSFAPIAQHHLFCEKDTPWKTIFLGSIVGFPMVGKILTCPLPFLMFLLNLCLRLNCVRTSGEEGGGISRFSPGPKMESSTKGRTKYRENICSLIKWQLICDSDWM